MLHLPLREGPHRLLFVPLLAECLHQVGYDLVLALDRCLVRVEQLLHSLDLILEIGPLRGRTVKIHRENKKKINFFQGLECLNTKLKKKINKIKKKSVKVGDDFSLNFNWRINFSEKKHTVYCAILYFASKLENLHKPFFFHCEIF